MFSYCQIAAPAKLAELKAIVNPNGFHKRDKGTGPLSIFSPSKEAFPGPSVWETFLPSLAGHFDCLFAEVRKDLTDNFCVVFWLLHRLTTSPYKL